MSKLDRNSDTSTALQENLEIVVRNNN